MRIQKQFKTSPVYFIGVVVLSFAMTVGAQAETSSCPTKSEGVPVGMQGLMCANGFFSITLADAVATGQGFQCHGLLDWTEKVWPKLIPDKTYTMNAGSAICVTTINFDVPEGYTLYVDGVETKTVEKSDGGLIFTGDGSWEVVLRKKCPCGKDDPGAAIPRVGSVLWELGMGKLADGRSAEHISISETILSANTYTPSVLIYSPPANTTSVDVVRNANGSLRQIKAPQAFADVVVINGSEFEIRYYDPANVGAKENGIYQLSGQPYVTWKITNPEPATTTKLRIIKYEAGQPQPVDQTEYVWDPAIDSWTMYTGWSQSTGYARIETRTVTYPTPTSRRESFIVKQGSSPFTVVSREDKIYLSYPWGEELVQEVVDPEGAALTTTYTYYEDPSFNQDHRYRKIKTIVFPDGSWEKRDYDLWFNISTVLRPWKDQPMETATIDNSNATIYGYSNSDNGVVGISSYPRIDYDVEERIQGVTVRKTRLNRSVASFEHPQQIATAESSYSDSENGSAVNLIKQTITTRYYTSAPQFLKNRTVSIEYPDGRKDSFTYEKGNYVPNADPALSQFIPDANGLAERATIVHGNVASPQGIAFKTTKETSVRDQSGNQVLQETYVYNGTDYERIGWTVNEHDARGHVLTVRDSRGQLSTAVWNGDFKTSEIDAAGVETTYAYDALGRVVTKTKKGIAAGAYPAQADIVMTLTYDAEGRQTGETVSASISGGGSLSLIRETTYDRAGRMTREKDSSRLETTYTYSNGGHTQTITRPGGAKEISDSYLDGQPKSVTGTALVPQYYDYGVNADGTRYTQEFRGPAGLSSPRWRKTTIDWVDRIITTEAPSFTGTNVVESLTYNSLSQLQKKTTMAGSTKLIADKLYEYDELGQPVKSGLDVNADGVLTLASTDRLVQTGATYDKVGSDWFRTVSTRRYLIDNSDSSVEDLQRERLTNFSLSGTDQTIAELSVTDVAGNVTTTTTTVDRTAKKHITTINTPDSNINAVSISINGLLQSATPTTPRTATTYSYDSLGRQISVTDPANGTTSMTFDGTTGQLQSTNDGAGATTYQYYPETHENAGLVKATINAAGKNVYFKYNSRGEVIQVWGDGTYPQALVYDSYGQRTELHTFRGGQNWSASIWPAATTGAADVTKWIYHESTGLVSQKQDATLKGASYTYDALGRLATRLSARGVTTTYGYDANTGELRTRTYSNSTPAASFSYDRGGRQASITDAAGTHARTFNSAGSLLTDQVTGGLLDGIGISIGYDSFLRRDLLQVVQGVNTLSSQSYTYDASSRLDTIAGNQTATYAYYPTTGLLNTTTFTGGTNVARSYDSIGRLQTIATTPAADPSQSYTYTHDNLHQRTRVTREDNSYWAYTYNDRGELLTGKKHWSDNSIVWGAQTEYSFDNIGNRKYARNGGNQLGSLRESTYTANSLNQYTQRSVPGAVDVTGTANTGSTVTVNNEATVRKGEYFYKELTVDNSTGPVYSQINVVGATNNFGAGGEDAVTTSGGRAFVPGVAEAFTYDDDGNLTSDGRWNYVWDAENRLTSMESTAAVPVEAKAKLEFTYDYMSRRVQKRFSRWNVGGGAYQLEKDTRYVYDGWNVIAELDGNNSLTRKYTWSSFGDLLLIADSAGGNYLVGNDANHNVVMLVNAATGKASASYEYDPFGNTIKSVGDFAAQNPIKFSSKYTDAETDLVYHPYRYYNPQIGRWLNRDPSEEGSGSNLYAFVDNSPTGATDPLGLWRRDDIWEGRRGLYSGTATAEECNESLRKLAWMVTGDESDWRSLGIPDRVQKGQKVPVRPLLRILESKLRTSVRRATRGFNAFFGASADVTAPYGSYETWIKNTFFSGTPKVTTECRNAADMVLLKGLIDVIREGEFDRVYKFHTEEYGIDIFDAFESDIGDSLEGDSVFLPNFAEYAQYGDVTRDAWQGENVIKVGVDLYWGFGAARPMSRRGWENLLRRENNALMRRLGRRERSRSERIPAFVNKEKVQIKFLRVPSIGMALFRERK